MCSARSFITSCRSWCTVAVALVAAACAREAPPPGGPVDQTPPDLVGVVPESLATSVDPEALLVFQFSEKPERKSFRSNLVLAPPLSVRSISFKGETVIVRPERPWPVDTLVVWSLLSSTKDKHGVPLGRTISGAFTTGPQIPDGKLRGQAVGEGLEYEQVMALLSVPPAEGERSSTRWRMAQSNEIGVFELGPLDLPSGPFELSVFQDKNGNARRDPREPVAERDSLYLSEDLRMLDLGSLELVDLEGPVGLRFCFDVSRMDTLALWLSLRPLGVDGAKDQRVAVDSTACAMGQLIPGEWWVSAWRDLNGDGRFGPDSLVQTEPFLAEFELEVLPASPDTLQLAWPEETLPWAEVDTMRTPPLPRDLFPEETR